MVDQRTCYCTSESSALKPKKLQFLTFLNIFQELLISRYIFFGVHPWAFWSRLRSIRFQPRIGMWLSLLVRISISVSPMLFFAEFYRPVHLFQTEFRQKIGDFEGIANCPSRETLRDWAWNGRFWSSRPISTFANGWDNSRTFWWWCVRSFLEWARVLLILAPFRGWLFWATSSNIVRVYSRNSQR